MKFCIKVIIKNKPLYIGDILRLFRKGAKVIGKKTLSIIC